jgi:hypothetical protein
MSHWFDTSKLTGDVKRIVETVSPPPPFPDLAPVDEDDRKYVVEEWKFRADLWKFQLTSMLDHAKLAGELTKLSITQLLTMNAGAALALLALCGNLEGRAAAVPTGLLASVGWSLGSFTVGVVSAWCVTLSTQMVARYSIQQRFDIVARWYAALYVAYAISIASFVLGIVLGARAILLR